MELHDVTNLERLLDQTTPGYWAVACCVDPATRTHTYKVMQGNVVIADCGAQEMNAYFIQECHNEAIHGLTEAWRRLQAQLVLADARRVS